MKFICLLAVSLLVSVSIFAQKSMAKPDLTSKALVKKWFAYRIAPPNGGTENRQISSMTIISNNAENSYKGEIEFGNLATNKLMTQPCTFTISSNKLNISTSDFHWTGEIYKSNGDSIIFGKKGEVLYYFKKIEIIKPVLNDSIPKYVIDLSAPTLIKEWFVFKAEAAPGFLKPETGKIRRLKITEQLGLYSYKGEIQNERFGKPNIQPCTITFNIDTNKNVTVVIIAEGYTWNMDISKIEGKDMMMGNKKEILYYLKTIR